MKKSGEALNVTYGLVVLVLFIAGIYVVYTVFRPHPKTSAENLAECTTNAGKLYDYERQTITRNANGYSPSEQQFYYQQSSDGYTKQLASCRQMYGQ
jgi:hypothetical protein